MMILMVTASVFILGIMLLMTSLRPSRSTLSHYELHRRKKAGDVVAAEALRREELIMQLEYIRQPFIALLLVALTLALVSGLGWRWGVSSAFTIGLLYTKAAGVSLLRRFAGNLYRPREGAILRAVERHKKKFAVLTGKNHEKPQASRIGSREELFHLVTESESVLSPDEKKLLTHAMAFSHRRADDIMTAREDIVSVEHAELLGPLVLSDLHKTGHSCFPVVAGGLDHVVGMLDIRGFLTLEAKRSITAAKAMTPHVFYVRGDQTLDHALASFIRTRHHLLVVIDEEGATLGLLSLRDVLEALFGRPMADEFASDGDLHVVATRQL